jgi:hypothetical protein
MEQMIVTYSVERGRPNKRHNLKRFWIVAKNANGQRTVLSSYDTWAEAELSLLTASKSLNRDLAA